MNQMFRCPSCKEVIRSGQPACQFCNSPIDEIAAHAEIVKFQVGIDACAAANHIKSLNYGAPILLLVNAAPMLFGLTDDVFSTSRLQAYASFLPFGSLAAAFGWLTKYGGLQTDDPDFPEAKRAVKKERPNHSFLIPEDQTGKFKGQIESNIRAIQSPSNLESNYSLPWEASFTVKTIAPGKQAFKVYATWDDDWMNVGWYEATDKEIFPQHYTSYWGPGLAVTRLPIVGLISAAIWITASRLIRRYWRRAA